ncbi:FkbM family methyltransferase [Chryseobacterium daecheongense]|uniref:FkbM family methyltransferase n=1 Tax=Chryseobacterium daecheongense TaxID=192389 RepID=UPI001FD6D094|nr:FkbM family methyltransferase [Chryseobacterium daecheongense]UOU97671.1 FkbM family methyltransferase [Chryseobacterium daecheongense]
MPFKNYISKLLFNSKISASFKTFIAFTVNSKRYSSQFKRNTLNVDNNETFVYNFTKRNKKFNLYLRTFKGDIDIFYEIFWKRTYEDHLKFLNQSPKIIIDLGAHIGMTSIYLSLKYPEAKIIAIEASFENFLLLKENTSAFKNIECVHNAVYFEDGFVNFGGEKLSYNQKISEIGSPIKAISINSLIKKFKLNQIDLLKIDIEGGEIDLLSKNNSWLEKVERIIIEIHRPYTSENLNKDLEPFGFKIKLHQDSVLFAKKE